MQDPEAETGALLCCVLPFPQKHFVSELLTNVSPQHQLGWFKRLEVMFLTEKSILNHVSYMLYTNTECYISYIS